MRTGNSTSCGCNHTPNLVGKKFGKLKVLSLASTDDKSRRYWNCECICGGTVVATTYQLREKIVKSCRECIFIYVNNTISVGEKFGEALVNAMDEFYASSNLITASADRSANVRATMLKMGANRIEVQLQKIIDLNKEFQQNILMLQGIDGYV